MGNVLVLYHSDSGNTANMARYVADGVRTVENIDLRLNSFGISIKKYFLDQEVI